MMIFPFKTAFENKNGNITIDNEIYNGTHFAIDNYKTQLYTEIKIGNPYQKVKFLLSAGACAIKIGKSSNCIYLDEYLSYYNRNKSIDFSYTSKYAASDMEFNFENGSTAIDTIYTYTDIKLKNEKEFKNVGFYLGSDTNDLLCGIIGLAKDSIICERMYNLIKDCKDKKYINNRKFMLKYNTINDGLFIIGSEFKDIIDNYDENNIFTTKISKSVTIYRFGFDINKIQLGNINVTLGTNVVGEINNDHFFIILGPQYLKNYSYYFFSKYLENKICTINIYDQDPKLTLSGKYDVIECDKKKFGENDLKNLPKLYIYIDEYYSEKKIYFDYKDLFTETKNKYFFNIIFDRTRRNKIDLGKIFLKKYPVNFDFDNNILEIYNNYIEKPKYNGDEQIENKDSSLILYIIISCILVIITGILGYFIGKYFNKIRKKRANELSDDYEYKNESPAEPINPESSINT